MAEPEYNNGICTEKTRGSKAGHCGFRPKEEDVWAHRPARPEPLIRRGDGPRSHIHRTVGPAPSRPSPLNAHLASSRRLSHLLYCYAPRTVLASGVGGLGGGGLTLRFGPWL
jgi:hypothetical protein